MGIIEFHKGCANDPGSGCFGPSNYYTIFDIPASHLHDALVPAMILGLCVYFILSFINKKTKFHISWWIRILISITLALFVLFWLAYFFFSVLSVS